MKVWKRGDKLTAKELNRIEEGIAEGASGVPSASTSTPIVTFDIVESMDDNETTYSASNFSLSLQSIVSKVLANEEIKLVGIRNKDSEVEYYIFFVIYKSICEEEQVILAKTFTDYCYELVLGVADNEFFTELSFSNA